MTNFRVGQLVVCVDAVPSVSGRRWLGDIPLEGRVYTVARIGRLSFDDGASALWLEEARNKVYRNHLWIVDCGFKASRFRPVATTDISWAHKLVADLPKLKGRVRVES